MARLHLVRTVAGLAALAGVGSAGDALAQNASDLERARQAFAQAMADEKAGAFDKAAGEFNDARTLAQKETPQVLFHLGVCHSRTGHLVTARDELQRAVQTAKAQGLDNVATTAQAELDQVTPRVAVLTVKKPAHGTVTSMTLDRAEATAKLGAPIDVDPGPHDVHVAFAEGAPADVHVTVADGEHKDVPVPDGGGAAAAVAAGPAPATAAGTETAPAVATAPGSGSGAAPDTGTAGGSGSSTVMPWVLVGGGAALAIGGAVFWAMRGSEISTLNGECGPGGQSCPSGAQSDIDKGKLDDTLGVSLFVAGGVAIVAGAGLLVLGGSHPAAAGTGVHVTPVISAHGGGVGLQGALW